MTIAERLDHQEQRALRLWTEASERDDRVAMLRRSLDAWQARRLIAKFNAVLESLMKMEAEEYRENLL